MFAVLPSGFKIYELLNLLWDGDLYIVTLSTWWTLPKMFEA